MAVETAVVDGEPAIVLDDDRTHDGRWVSIETAWLKDAIGEVPDAAYIDHEGNEYAAPQGARRERGVLRPRVLDEHGHVRRRGDAVRRRAGDGTEYQYELGSTEDVDDPSINLTGISNTQL